MPEGVWGDSLVYAGDALILFYDSFYASGAEGFADFVSDSVAAGAVVADEEER